MDVSTKNGSSVIAKIAGIESTAKITSTIPITALDQFGATFARWFGVPEAALPQIFPNLGRFGSSTLGFMA